MTQDKKIPELIEVSDNESKCSLGDWRTTSVAKMKGRRRTKAEQRRTHENQFREHVRVAHPEAYVSVEKVEVNPVSADPENAEQDN